MNKTEKGVTIKEQNKAEKTNMSPDKHQCVNPPQVSGVWFCCKWKEVYDCPKICCNCCIHTSNYVA